MFLSEYEGSARLAEHSGNAAALQTSVKRTPKAASAPRELQQALTW